MPFGLGLDAALPTLATRCTLRPGDRGDGRPYTARMVSYLEVHRDPARLRLRRRLRVVRVGPFAAQEKIQPGQCIEVLRDGARPPYDWTLVPAVWHRIEGGAPATLPVDQAFGRASEGLNHIRCLVPITGFGLADAERRRVRRLRMVGKACFLVGGVALEGRAGAGVLSVSLLTAPWYVDQTRHSLVPLVVSQRSASYWFERPDDRLLLMPAGVVFTERE
mgnify:CR=1 FL=1